MLVGRGETEVGGWEESNQVFLPAGPVTPEKDEG